MAKKGIEAGRAYVKAYLEDSAIKRGLKSLRSHFDSFASGLMTVGTRMFAVGAAAGGIFGAPLKRAAEMEQISAAFESLTGSAEIAAKVMADVRKFGVETPFEFPELADASRLLLAFGVSADDLIPTLRSVGDVASAIGAPLGEIAEIYGKARVQGRLFMEDINQLTGRGIPVIGELAKQFGVAESEIRELVSDGKVNFGHLEQAFESLTGPGGKFFGMMDRQSKTLLGRWSTLKDTFWDAITPLGEALIPHAGKLLGIVSGLAGQLGRWIKANAAVTVKLVAMAAAVMSLGAAAVALSLTMRGLSYVIAGLGIAIKAVLIPATMAAAAFRGLMAASTIFLTSVSLICTSVLGGVALALRTVGAAAVATAATIKTMAMSIALVRKILLGLVWVLGAAKVAGYAFVAAGKSAAIAVTALGLATRATLMVTAVLVPMLRAAGLAFAALGAIINATALAVTGVGAVLGLLGNPIGGLLLALGLVALAINHVRGASVDWGGILDWLKDRFGPLTEAASRAFGVIKDALMAGDFKTAADLLWKGLLAAFLKGKIELLKVWDGLTSEYQKSWTETLAAVVGVFTRWGHEAKAIVHDVLAVLNEGRAAFADLIGNDEMAIAWRANVDAHQQAAFAERRGAESRGNKAQMDMLASAAAADAARPGERAKQAQEAEDALKDFNGAVFGAADAMNQRKEDEFWQREAEREKAEEERRQQEADTEKQMKGVGEAAKPAVNSAAVLGTQAAQDAFVKGTTGFGRITDGEKAIVDAVKENADAINKLAEQGVVLAEGPIV